VTPRKRSVQPPSDARAETRENDPRFIRLCNALAKDPRYAAAVADFRAQHAAAALRRFGSNGLRVGGRVFAMMAQGTLVVKLPRSRVDALVAAGDGERFDPGHGRTMKEWFVVTNPNIRWPALAAEAYDFVATQR
jgi:hypothetical protein